MFSFMYVLIVVFLALPSVSAIHGAIVDVSMQCGASQSEKSTISVIADVPIFVTATCRSGAIADFTTDNGVSYILDVYPTGSDSSLCYYSSINNVGTYKITILVGYGASHDGVGIQDQAERYLLTCIYDQAGTNIGEDTSRTISDALQAPEEIQRNMGPAAVSTFNLFLVDVVGNKLEGDIQLGRKTRLEATITGDNDEVGFTTTSCLAIGGSIAYPILVGGCGDGIIIPLDEGFTSTGLKIESPYFAVFSLLGSEQLKFQCNFTACYNTSCDGDSCTEAARRRRRGIDTSLWDSLDFKEKALGSGDDIDFGEDRDGHIQLESLHTNVVNETCVSEKDKTAHERRKRAAFYGQRNVGSSFHVSLTMVAYSTVIVLAAIAIIWLVVFKQRQQDRANLVERARIEQLLQRIEPIPAKIKHQYEARQCR